MVLFDCVADDAVQKTEDHNPANKRELQRVQSQGGQLSSDGQYVVLQSGDGLQQDLGVTRALGHAQIKAYQRSLLVEAEQQQQLLLLQQPTPGSAGCGCDSNGVGPGPQGEQQQQQEGQGQQVDTVGPAPGAPPPAPRFFRLHCEPEWGEFEVGNQHILIAGCDGLFEREGPRNTLLARHVRGVLSSTDCAHAAAAEACMRSFRLGSQDNITALVLKLGAGSVPMRRTNSVLKLSRATSCASSADLQSALSLSAAASASASLLASPGGGGGGLMASPSSVSVTPAASMELPS